jgi:Polyketide cyclase / dehydrase and lipid transport
VSPSRTLSVSIARPVDEVYRFVADPLNLPRWAEGLGGAVRKSGEGWIVDSANGPLGLRFAACNALGVLDHWVSVAPGVEVYVPMRVIANGAGAEIVFTLFRTPEMSDVAFAADAALVQRDLEHLRRLLEA